MPCPYAIAQYQGALSLKCRPGRPSISTLAISRSAADQLFYHQWIHHLTIITCILKIII